MKFLYHLISKPLGRLVSLTNSFGRGERDIRTSLPHTGSEVGQLAAAFDQMSAEIKDQEEQRKKTEEELNEYRLHLEKIIAERTYDLTQSEALLNEAQRITHVGNWTMDVQTGRMSCSDEYLRIFGFEEGIEMPTYDEHLKLVCPEDREHFDNAIRNSLKSGEAFRMEVGVYRADGKYRTMYTWVKAQRGETGEVVRLVGIVQDITERKQIETDLQKANDELEIRVEARTAELSMVNRQMKEEIVVRMEAEELYRATTNNSHTGIYIIQDGKFQFLNPRAATCIGYHPDELIGVDPRTLSIHKI